MFRTRDLSDVELEYLFLDSSHFKFHQGSKAEPVLVAWGITTTGKPVLLHLAPGASESTDACAGFLDDMAGRALRPPLLVVSDRAPGLMAAGEMKLPRSLWQSCLIHRRVTSSPGSPSTPRPTRGSTTGRSSTASSSSPGPGPGRGASPGEALRPEVASAVPGRCRVPRGRLRAPRLLPAVLERALEANPPLQLHRTQLRRDPLTSEGDRPATRRAEVPVTRVGRARSRIGGPAYAGSEPAPRADRTAR